MSINSTVSLHPRTQPLNIMLKPERESLLSPVMVDDAFRRMLENASEYGTRITLSLDFRYNMLMRESKEWKYKQSLLAIFIQNSVDLIRTQEAKNPNWVGINEILSYIDKYDLLRAYENQVVKQISHIDITINLEKRKQSTIGKNTKDRWDYILSYGRRLRMGGNTAPEIGRHSLLTHIGCSYNDFYPANVDTSSLDYINDLFSFLDTPDAQESPAVDQEPVYQGGLTHID